MAQNDPEADKVTLVAKLSDTNYTEGAKKRGERLFRGYIPFENNSHIAENTTVLYDSTHTNFK